MSTLITASTASAYGTSFTINAPVGVADGDFVCLGMATAGNLWPYLSFPGYSFSFLSGPSVSGYPTSRFLYKVASSEPASYTFTSSSNCGWVGVCWAYRGLVAPTGYTWSPISTGYYYVYNGQSVSPDCYELNSAYLPLTRYRVIRMININNTTVISMSGVTNSVGVAVNSTTALCRINVWDQDYVSDATTGYGPDLGRKTGSMSTIRQNNCWTIALHDSTTLKETDMSLSGGGTPAPSGPLYRMRAYDGTLGYYVYWTATIIDSTGSQYTGPGPLSDVVVSKIIGAA